MRKKDSIVFHRPPSVLAWAAVGGKKEAEGPLGNQLDAATAAFYARVAQSAGLTPEQVDQLRELLLIVARR